MSSGDDDRDVYEGDGNSTAGLFIVIAGVIVFFGWNVWCAGAHWVTRHLGW